jgi:hypothetical protein
LLTVEQKKTEEISLLKKDDDGEANRILRISDYAMIKDMEMIVEKLPLSLDRINSAGRKVLGYSIMVFFLYFT